MRTILFIGLVLTILGCQGRLIGHFGEGAFYHARGHYRIRQAASGEGLLPPRWRLTNYAIDDDGRPTMAQPEVHGFETLDTRWLGARERRSIDVPRVDLHYRDETGEAEIWVRTMVIPRAWRNASPARIMHTSVAGLGDPAPPLDPLGRRFGPTDATLRRYGEARVDGQVAHWIELDVTRGSIAQRITLVGMRPGAHQWEWRRRHRFPMMLVFGFSSPPDEHESVRRDFVDFVSRVDVAPGRAVVTRGP